MAIRITRLGSSNEYDAQGQIIGTAFCELDVDDVTNMVTVARYQNTTTKAAMLELWQQSQPTRIFRRQIRAGTPFTETSLPTGAAARINTLIIDGRIAGLEGNWEWPYI